MFRCARGLIVGQAQATLLLSAMGANVIKIDDPKTGDRSAFSPPYAGPNGISFHKQTESDMGLAYLKRARGKKSVNLDLKNPEGYAIFLQLVKHADVVVDNFGAGVAARLKVDYPSLCKANPSIIYCSLTGYGSTGPDKNFKAYDLMIQAAVGLMSVTGESHSPPIKAGSPISDVISGAYAAMGILGALFHQQRTGQGQEIDVSMADCLFSMIYDEPFDCYQQLGIPQRQGNRIMRFSPFNVYETKDGWLAIGAATNQDWAQLLTVIDKKELIDDPNMMDVGWRIENNSMIDSIVSDWSKGETSISGLEKLHAKNIPCSPVRTMQEAIKWEQLQERKMISHLVNPLSQSNMDASGPGFPIKFSKTPASYDTPSPIPGEHTEAILESLTDLSKEELIAFIQKGVLSNFHSLKTHRP
uniref:CaiB/BaiF CoA transferase family protein n=1 Tax=Orrella sp. TaxID=1921583 RepID=UPI0040470B79